MEKTRILMLNNRFALTNDILAMLGELKAVDHILEMLDWKSSSIQNQKLWPRKNGSGKLILVLCDL